MYGVPVPSFAKAATARRLASMRMWRIVLQHLPAEMVCAVSADGAVWVSRKKSERELVQMDACWPPGPLLGIAVALLPLKSRSTSWLGHDNLCRLGLAPRAMFWTKAEASFSYHWWTRPQPYDAKGVSSEVQLQESEAEQREGLCLFGGKQSQRPPSGWPGQQSLDEHSYLQSPFQLCAFHPDD